MSQGADLARLEAEVAALKQERALLAERASERIRRERGQIQAEAARIKAKTKELLATAKRELERLTREHAALTQEVKDLHRDNQALAARLAALDAAGGAAAHAPGCHPAPGRGKLATTLEVPAPGTHAGRAGTAIIPVPRGLEPPDHPPVPVRPPRPDFVKKTQVIGEGKAAVWQDAAKQVREVDVKGGPRKKAARAEQKALASEDLARFDSRPELHIESIEESGDAFPAPP